MFIQNHTIKYHKNVGSTEKSYIPEFSTPFQVDHLVYLVAIVVVMLLRWRRYIHEKRLYVLAHLFGFLNVDCMPCILHDY